VPDVKFQMWAYQLHFQANAQHEARSLFSQLDPRFDPRVFLVGFQAKPIKDRPAICVVPDDCEYQPEVFAHVREAADNMERSDPGRKTPPPHPKAQASHHFGIKRRALWTAILQAVKSATETGRWVTFCSGAAEVKGYLVSVVLQLQGDVYDSYYRLQKDVSRAPFTYDCPIERSFLEAVVGEFLSATAERLTKPNAGDGFRNIADPAPILQAAAKSLMYTASAAGENPNGLHGLYEACNTISTLKYEGTDGVGRLVIAKRGHHDVEVDLLLARPVLFHDYGAVRKLLQMASGDLSLLSDSYEIYGLGTVRGSYKPVREDLFVVNFSRHFVWELTHAGQPLMYLRYGEPGIRTPGFPDERFRVNLARVFPALREEQAQRLCHLGRALAELKHGCMMVVTADAAEEAARLASQGTPVKPFPLDSKLLPFVSSIDGAVLIDLDGKCHALGVILDGMASRKCTPSRGARYNSAIRYVYGRSDAVAVVKSEDGMIDVVPDLTARIRRSDLNAALDELRRIAHQETVEPEEFYKVRDWLNDHRFYLSKGHCEEVNRLVAQAMDRFPEGAWKTGYREFTSDDAMNDSYFLEE
jgi:DisA bacterial checkpoint controller nucleotide-binding